MRAKELERDALLFDSHQIRGEPFVAFPVTPSVMPVTNDNLESPRFELAT